MKELTLQEVLSYEEGSRFKIKLDGGDSLREVVLKEDDLIFIDGAFENENIAEVFTLKAVLKSNYYLIEAWKEISYYDAYVSNKQVKFVADDVEQIGTHYGILSELDSKGKDIKELLYQGKWYIKEANL